VYAAYDLTGGRPTYASLGRDLGISETEVRNHLFAAREEIRDEIRKELLEIDDDWGSVFGD
jgi:hypothetical protein